jgi:hypothetical protein
MRKNKKCVFFCENSPIFKETKVGWVGKNSFLQQLMWYERPDKLEQIEHIAISTKNNSDIHLQIMHLYILCVKVAATMTFLEKQCSVPYTV